MESGVSSVTAKCRVVWSVKCGEWSVKFECRVWSVKCGVSSVSVE